MNRCERCTMNGPCCPDHDALHAYQWVEQWSRGARHEQRERQKPGGTRWDFAASLAREVDYLTTMARLVKRAADVVRLQREAFENGDNRDSGVRNLEPSAWCEGTTWDDYS